MGERTTPLPLYTLPVALWSSLWVGGWREVKALSEDIESLVSRLENGSVSHKLG